MMAGVAEVVKGCVQEQDEMRKMQLEHLLEGQKEAVVAAALAGDSGIALSVRITIADALRHALLESLQHALSDSVQHAMLEPLQHALLDSLQHALTLSPHLCLPELRQLSIQKSPTSLQLVTYS